MKRRGNSIAGNPILIGAATILVSVVAVFLAYNANEGLPFVPNYKLTAQVPNAVALVKGNEVKIGGSRVGMVTAIEPKTWPDGRVTALVEMQLDKKIEPIPADSTIEIRPVSPLGLKYVDIHRGVSTEGISSGSTIPLAAATPRPVQIDQIFNMFDKPTRDASSANLIEFGNAIGGRGLDLNRTIRNLGPLLTNLEPVMKNLSDPNTGLVNLFPALERAASQAAPVGEQQASMFRGLNATFAALAGVTSSIQATIEGGPPALDAAIASLPVQRPFLDNSATLFNTLIPGSQALGGSAATLAAAAKAGASPTGGIARSPDLNARLSTLLLSLQTFLKNSDTRRGVTRLITTVSYGTGNQLIPFVAPTQTKCNYAALLLRNVASVTASEFVGPGNSGGSFLRGLAVLNGWANKTGTNQVAWDKNEIQGSSEAPAAGPTGANSYGSNVAHSNSYPYTAAPGQPESCEAGNERFAYQIKDPNDPDGAKFIVVDQPNMLYPVLDSATALDPARGTSTEPTFPPVSPPSP